MDPNKCNIRINALKWVDNFYYEKHKLSLEEALHISEIVTDYIETGITPEITKKTKSVDRHLKKKSTSSGSLTVKI